MKGVIFFETYAPVVSWTTIRLFLTLKSYYGLAAVQVDFRNVFTQDPLPELIFTHPPRGLGSSTGKKVALKLNSGLYRLRQAPLIWFDHLKDEFLRNGFVHVLMKFHNRSWNVTLFQLEKNSSIFSSDILGRTNFSWSSTLPLVVLYSYFNIYEFTCAIFLLYLLRHRIGERPHSR